MYQLTINGTTASGVSDLNGNFLLNGQNYVAVLPLITQPATVSLTLEAASDSGISHTDHITNVKTPTFDVAVNKAGRIVVTYGAAGSQSRLVSSAGTYTFTLPSLANNSYRYNRSSSRPSGRVLRTALR